MADSFEQYNPSTEGQPFNKSISINGDIDIDSKAYYYNKGKFLQRPYLSKAEVFARLLLSQRKDGQKLYINTGGTLNTSNGKIEGGTNDWYYFKDGVTLDSHIVKLSGTGITDGNKQDITSSQSGNTLTINPKAVTTAKLDDKAVSTSKIKADIVNEDGYLRRIPNSDTAVWIKLDAEIIMKDYEPLVWQSIMNIQYDSELPNKSIIIPDNVDNTDTIINYIGLPSNMVSKFYIQKSNHGETIIFNGQVQTPIPTTRSSGFIITANSVNNNLIWTI